MLLSELLLIRSQYIDISDSSVNLIKFRHKGFQWRDSSQCQAPVKQACYSSPLICDRTNHLFIRSMSEVYCKSFLLVAPMVSIEFHLLKAC